MGKIIGAIDAGGTTFKCAVLNENRDILAYERIKTTDPQTTFLSCLEFFGKCQPVESLGIACFGPLNLDMSSTDRGQIHNTPKPGWSGANPRQWFADHMNVPVNIETDVNAALLAERAWGAAQNTSSSVYITVGTGIGAGIYANGALLGRPHHAEFGHIPVERHPEDKNFEGLCPYHGNCLEGMASANALWERFGDPEKLSADHLAWTFIADYLAQACQVLILTLRPQKILLGGGLMQAPHIIQAIQDRTFVRLANYAGIKEGEIRSVICRPDLGDDAGLLGGAYLAIG